MNKVRSRAVKQDVNIKRIIKKSILIGAPILISLAVILIVASAYYTKVVTKYLDYVEQMQSVDGFQAMSSTGSAMRAVNGDAGEIRYIVATDKEQDTDEEETDVYLLIEGDLCYINIQDITTSEQREKFGGKTWLSIDKEKLYKDGVFKASDILNCIDVDLYRNELADSSIFTKGIKGIKYLLSKKASDTFGKLDDDKIIITDTEKFITNLSGRYIDVVGDYRNDLNGKIEYVEINDFYAGIVGKDKSVVKVIDIRGEATFDRVSGNIEMMSTPIESIGKLKYDKFISDYKKKNLIESLKGAFEE